MAVYTRYAQVLDAEGKSVSVRAALELINQTLDESLAEQEGDFDADTREAWAQAYDLLATVMCEAAEHTPQTASAVG